jgi:hypothetical protein
MQRVINFSGGRTSAYMTIRYYQCGDIVLFCDTGREHDKTYKFIHDFEAHEGIPIIWLKYDGGFDGLLKRRPHSIPNQAWRFCTEQLKSMTARKYLRENKIKVYENIIGFRADEPQRVLRHKDRWKTVVTKFPLYEDGIVKQNVIDFWKSKEYDLEVPSILGNCDLCFLKGKANLISIMKQFPELADKWIADEQRVNATYIKGISYSELLEISKRPEMKQQDLFELKPAFNCACTT